MSPMRLIKQGSLFMNTQCDRILEKNSSLFLDIQGIVTRRPLVLQLHKLEEGKSEYREFLHAPRRNLLILARTFGVLTKLDLMDQGTNALDVLEGRLYRLLHPWVGIVNRSQAEINKYIDMIDARRKVQKYFASSPDYGHLESKMGSEYLAKLLSKVLAANVVALAWNVILSFKAHKEVVLK